MRWLILAPGASRANYPSLIKLCMVGYCIKLCIYRKAEIFLFSLVSVAGESRYHMNAINKGEFLELEAAVISNI